MPSPRDQTRQSPIRDPSLTLSLALFPSPFVPSALWPALGAVAAVPCPVLPCAPTHSPQSARNNNLPQGEPLVDYAASTGCPPPSWSSKSHGTSSSRRPLLLHRATGQ